MGEILQFKVRYATADIHEDSYQTGEGKYTQSFDVLSRGATFSSVDEIIQEVASVFGNKASAENFGLMFDDGKNGFVRLVTDIFVDSENEYVPDDDERVEKWKEGEYTLYNAFVDVGIEVTRVEYLSEAEIEEAFKSAGVNDVY